MRERWVNATIGEVCQLVNGGTPKTNVNDFWDGPHAWITPAEMGKLDSPYVSKTSRTITDEGLSKSSANLLPPKSLILSSRAPIGHLVINEVPMATNQGCKGLIPKKSLYYKYLYYFLFSAKALLNDLGTGTTFKELSATRLKGVSLPLPSISEQKRIVTILDEAFEGIATAVANAEKNLANVRELFESELNAVFSRKGEGLVETKLGEVCQFENGDRGKNYPNKSEYVDSGIPWINTGHIQPDGTLSRSEMNYISREKFESLRSGKIQSGDLVYCLRGATLGKTALVDPFTVGAVASSLVIIRPGGLLDCHYLYYFLTSSRGKGLIKLYDNGAAQPNLGAKSVAKYTITLPKISEQKAIVHNLTSLATEAQRLEAIYKQKLTILTELKQSILQKAFTGELTSSNVVAFTRPVSEQQAMTTTSPEFGAHVIAYGYHWHEGQRKNRTYGHVKTQKFLHLAESVADVDMGRSPEKCAAGPHDAQHMRQAEDWARENQFFEFVQRSDGKGYDFKKLANFNQLIGDSINAVKPYQDKIQKILSLLLPMKTREAEVLATVHAAWNNLLLDNAKITDDAIIHEARENWTESKRSIPENEFRKAIRTIRTNGIVPDGTARRVRGQESLPL